MSINFRFAGHAASCCLKASVLVIVMALIPPDAAWAANAYTWLLDSTTEGWTATNATLSIVSSALRVHPTTSDPQTYTPTLSFTATAHDYIRIQIKSANTNNQFQIYFKTAALSFSETRTKIYTLTNDNAFHYATIPLSGTHSNSQFVGIPSWSTAGTVTQVRLDPARATTGDVDYGFVVLRQDDKAPYVPVVDAVSPSTFTTGTINVTVHGDDPPPVGFTGTASPDMYASGVFDFGWSIDGGAETWQQNSGYDLNSGRASATLSYGPGSIPNGCHTLSIRSRDRCGLIGPSVTTMLYVGPDPGYRIVGRSTSYETGLPVGGDVLSYGYPEGSCGPVWGQVSTDANGYFSTPGLPFGSYSIGAGSCDDVVFSCGTGNPIVIGCSGSVTANFRQKGLPALAITSVAPRADGQSIAISWSGGNAQTDSYRLYRSSSLGGPFSTLVDLAATSYIDGGLTCGATYYYEIAPINGCSRLGAPSVPVGGTNSLCLPPVSLQAPTYGLNVKFPETFSWTPPSGATVYDAQLSHDASFSTIDWSTSCSALSVRIPAGAAPIFDSDYYWRARARNAQYTSDWAASMVHTASFVPMPAQVVRTGPADGGVNPGRTCVFAWGQAASASSYRLEIAGTADFASGAGSSIVQSGITSLYSQVTLGPEVTDVYWRVAGQNALGLGPYSDVGHFVLSATAEGLAGVAITEPASDVIAVMNGPLDVKGLLVGQVTGTLSAQWLWDGVPVGSQSIDLTGSGADTPPFEYTPSALGAHDLTLIVDGPIPFTSVRNVTVVDATFGAPTQLTVYAEAPVLIAGDTTLVYCTVRDANGQLVLSDNGRQIRFSLVKGLGALAGPTQPTVNGVAFTLYQSAAADTEIKVQADEEPVSPGGPGAGPMSAPALAPGNAIIQACTEVLAQRQLALGFLKLLHDVGEARPDPPVGLAVDRNVMVPVDGFDFLYRPLAHIETRDAEAFVNSCNDARRLKRLVLFLRMMNRSMYYGTRTFMYPNTDVRIADTPGLCKLAEEFGLCQGEYFSTVVDAALARVPFKIVFDIGACITSIGPVKRRNDAYQNLMSQVTNQMLYAPRRTVPVPAQDNFRRQLSRNLKEFGRALSDASFLTAGNVGLEVLSPGWSAKLAIEANCSADMLSGYYVPVMQNQLNGMVDYLARPNVTLGDDAVAADVSNRLLQTVRRKASVADAEFMMAKAAIEAQSRPVYQCLDFPAKLSEYVFGVDVYKRLKKLFVVNASVGTFCTFIDCLGEIDRACLALRGEGGYVPPSSTRSAALAERQSRPVGPAGRMWATRVVEIISDDLNTHVNSYEAAAREMERCILAADPGCASDALTALDATASSLTDAEDGYMGPFFAVLPSARYSSPAFSDLVDSLAAARSSDSDARGISFQSAQDWLTMPDNEALRDAAVAALRAGIDSTGVSYTLLRDRLPMVLGELGTPFLMLSAPQVSRDTYFADSVTVSLTVRNLGGAPATGTHITLTPGAGTLQFLSDASIALPQLDPGQAVELAWQVRGAGAVADSDTLVMIPVVIAPDSLGAPGTTRSASLSFSIDRAVLAAPPPRPLVFELASPSPNPNTGRVAIRFSLPRTGSAQVSIFDIAGRIVHTVTESQAAAGAHTLTWDGRDRTGRRVEPGTYFVRLRAGDRAATRAIIILR